MRKMFLPYFFAFASIIIIKSNIIAQTSVYWRTDGPSSGNWLHGSTCDPSGDGQWYYNSWGGFRQKPDCYGFHDVYFDGNGINTMNLNGVTDFTVRSIYFTSNATVSRFLNTDAGRTLYLNAHSTVDPKIENNSSAAHTFNVPVVLNNWAQINPVNGDLAFLGNINMNANLISVFGSNSKVLTITGDISGTGGISLKQNSKIVLSTVSKSYTGATVIEAGNIELSVSLASSLITVKSGAKLTVTGTDVTINTLAIESGGIVEVQAGKALTINGTLINSAGATGLVVASSGSLITKSTVSGSATIQRDITADFKWHFLSSPVSGQLICDGTFAPLPANFNSTTGATYDFFRWSEPIVSGGLNWLNLKNTDWSLNTSAFNDPPQFGVGTGYLVAYGSAFSGSTTKSFAGPLTTGDQSIVLTIGGNTWNLIGNPFASAIDWNGVTTTNLANGYYYVYNEAYQGGDNYAYYLDNDHKIGGANGKISAMQGFFVQANGSSIVLPNAARVHDNNWMKTTQSAPVDQLIVKLSNSTNYDEALLIFEAQGTTGLDFFDAQKMFSLSSENPQVYSINDNGNNIAINSMPFNSAPFSIPLGIYIPADGTYSLNVSGIESFTSVPSIILQDLKLNTTQDLGNNPVYQFTASSTDDPNRFVLNFSAVTVGLSNPVLPTTSRIYISNRYIYIEGLDAKAEILVRNMLGQVVASRNANGTGAQVINTANLTAGVYVVSVVTGKQVVSEKVVIK